MGCALRFFPSLPSLLTVEAPYANSAGIKTSGMVTIESVVAIEAIFVAGHARSSMVQMCPTL